MTHTTLTIPVGKHPVRDPGTAAVVVASPVWRGRLHQGAFLVALPLGMMLVGFAQSPAARLGALVYALGSLALYGVSAAYHLGRWSPRSQVWMRRLDHAMIFVLIAATYTPFCLLAAAPGHGVPTLLGVWMAAGVGVGLSLAGLAERRGLGLALYLAIGWLGALSLPSLLSGLPPMALALIIAGGMTYTLGAIGLVRRWPDPLPAFFGYHEVWHAMTLIAGACFAVVVWALVTGA